MFHWFKRLEPQSNNNVAAAGSNYGSIANVHNDYERGDIALGDVKKQNNVYERGDIALGDVKKQNNVNADYGVLPVNDGYTTLPSISDGYGVMPTSSNWNQQSHSRVLCLQITTKRLIFLFVLANRDEKKIRTKQLLYRKLQWNNDTTTKSHTEKKDSIVRNITKTIPIDQRGRGAQSIVQ